MAKTVEENGEMTSRQGCMCRAIAAANPDLTRKKSTLIPSRLSIGYQDGESYVRPKRSRLPCGVALVRQALSRELQPRGQGELRACGPRESAVRRNRMDALTTGNPVAE